MAISGPMANTAPLPWLRVCSEFASLPALVKRINVPERAYEISSMIQSPAYQVLESLLGEMTIVFSPPKVAGQTITATLWGLQGQPEPHHIHFLSDHGFAFMEALFERCRVPLNKNRWAEFIAHSRWVRVLLTANKIVRETGLGSLVPKPVLIAGVREPMAQYLSLVFEHWWMYVDRIEDLTLDFFHKHLRDDPWRHQCNHWFKNELQEMTGIDVFARPFPAEQGWDIYENDQVRVLVIRQENLDRLPQALAKLHGVDATSIAVESRNIGDAKDYSAQYNAIKNAWLPDEDELREIYSPSQVRHFYSTEEIARFQKRWKANAKSASPAATAPQASPDVSAPTPLQARPEQVQPGVAMVKPQTATAKPAKHPHHPATCRPCPQCASEIQQLPIFQQICEERLQVIMHVEKDWKLQFLRKCHRWYRKIFRWGGPVPR